MIKLLKVIDRRIYPGTTIMSDKWKSYHNLKIHGYVHFSVKRKLKKKETNVTKYLDEYLLEYCYKKKFENRVFEQTLIDIRKKYKLK